MDRQRIKCYMETCGGFEIAALQERFSASYREIKTVVDELLNEGKLQLYGGLTYVCVQPDKNKKYGGHIKNYRGLHSRRDFDDDDELDDTHLFAYDEDDDELDDDFDVDDAMDDIEECLKKLEQFEKTGQSEDSDKTNREIYSQEAENLVGILKFFIEEKSKPIQADEEPSRSLWRDGEFYNELYGRINKMIESDKKLGHRGAINRAELMLEGVRDTHDRKQLQLYEYMVFLLKSISTYDFNQVRKIVWG